MALRLVDLTLPRPEENLALDEALLRICDAELRRGAGSADSGFLRFWESPVHFVVLGVSRRLRDDVEVEPCSRDGIPILRRASGGGTVLQGPGCLNLSLVLPLESDSALRDVNRSYRRIVERCVEALALKDGAMKGTSDLAMGERKFGGSAQKRTARALLHHASILYDFDLDLLSRYLKEPAEQPDYRRGRTHADFVANLPLSAREVRRRVARSWRAEPVSASWTTPPLEELIAEKYGRREWTERF